MHSSRRISGAANGRVPGWICSSFGFGVGTVETGYLKPGRGVEGREEGGEEDGEGSERVMEWCLCPLVLWVVLREMVGRYS